MNNPQNELVLKDMGGLLLEAVSMLRSLPRSVERISQAKLMARHWLDRQPTVLGALLVDQPPGSEHAEYDVLLTIPEVGTIAISWREDTGTPWLVNYADHWASNYVVTLNDEQKLTVQQALMMLRAVGRSNPDVMTAMVDQLIYEKFIDDSIPIPTQSELQAAADQFRQAWNLHSAKTTQSWLEESGLSMQHFEEMLAASIRVEKFKAQVVVERFNACFVANRFDYERVSYTEVRSLQHAVVLEIAYAAANTQRALYDATSFVDLMNRSCEGSFGVRLVCELHESFRNAEVGDIVGPYVCGQQWVVAQIVRREPAMLDKQTHRALAERISRDWLDEQRAHSRVRWHWF